MVNFNDAQTIGTPAVDIVRVLFLQARANLLDAWELYTKHIESGVSGNIELVRARLKTWFYEIQPGLKRKYKENPEAYEEILEAVLNSPDEKQIEELILLFNEYLDEIRLTRIDTKPSFDRTDIEMDNEIHNY